MHIRVRDEPNVSLCIAILFRFTARCFGPWLLSSTFQWRMASPHFTFTTQHQTITIEQLLCLVRAIEEPYEEWLRFMGTAIVENDGP